MNWIFISLLFCLPATSWCAPKFPDEGIHVNSDEEHLELKRIEEHLKGIEDKIDAVSEVIVEDDQLGGIQDKLDAISEVMLEDEPEIVIDVKSKDQLTETNFKAGDHLTEIDVKSENNHILEGIDEKATDNHLLEGIDDKATDNHLLEGIDDKAADNLLDGIKEQATDHLLELIDERDSGIHLLDIHAKTVEGFHHSGDDVQTDEEHLSKLSVKSEEKHPSEINEKAKEEDISNNGTEVDHKRVTGLDRATDNHLLDTPVKTNEDVHQSEDDLKTEGEHLSQLSVKSEESHVSEINVKADEKDPSENGTEADNKPVAGIDKATDTSAKTNEDDHQSEDDVKTEEEHISRSKENHLSEISVKAGEEDLSNNGKNADKKHETGTDNATDTSVKTNEEVHETEDDVKTEEEILSRPNIKSEEKHLLEINENTGEEAISNYGENADKATDTSVTTNEEIHESEEDVKSEEEILSRLGVSPKEQNLPESNVQTVYTRTTVEEVNLSGDDVVIEEEHLSLLDVESEDLSKINVKAAKEYLSGLSTKVEEEYIKGDFKIEADQDENLAEIDLKDKENNLSDTRTTEEVDLSGDDVVIEEEHLSLLDVESEDLSKINVKAAKEDLPGLSTKVDEDYIKGIDFKTEADQDENLAEIDLKDKENNLLGTRTTEEADLFGDDVVIEEEHLSLLDVESENLSKINIKATKEDLSGLSTRVDEEYIKGFDFKTEDDQDENLAEIDLKVKELDQEGVEEMIVKIFNPEEDLTEDEVANQTNLDSIQVQKTDPISPVVNDNIAALNESNDEVGEGQYGILMSRLMDMVGIGNRGTNSTDIESKHEEEHHSEIGVKAKEDLSEDDVNMISHIYLSDYEDLAGSNETAEESEVEEIADDQQLTETDETIQDEDSTGNDATVEEKNSTEIGLVEQSKAFVGKLLDLIGLRNSATSPVQTCSPSSPLYYTDLSDPNCKHFYHCSEGHEPSLIECPSRTRWSPKLHTCDHEENVPCPRTTSDDISVARCEFKGHGTGEVFGEVLISQVKDDVNGSHFQGKIIGLTPGLHGFHVHAVGALGDDCQAAGGHFNPEEVNHGGKDGDVRHVGDLGNILARQSGALVDIWDGLALLEGTNSIVGKAIVVHEGQDDEGLGENEGSLVHGNAGARAGCCIIEEV